MPIKEIHHTLHKLTRGENAHWLIQKKTGYLLRLTNNYIHQSGFQDEIKITVRVIRGGRLGLAETTDTSREGLQAAIQIAEHALNLEESRNPLLSRQNKVAATLVSQGSSYLILPPSAAARKIKTALECIKQLGAKAHGYFSNYEWRNFIGNSGGLALDHATTGAKFGLTVNRGNGSGYHTFYHPNAEKIDFLEIAEESLKHACLTEREVQIKPGRYPVILAPRALAAFLSNFLEEWNGLRFQEKESFLIHYKNKKLASSVWNVWDDVTHPLQTGIPFDAEGDGRKKVSLVKNGRFDHVVYDRWTAMKFGEKNTGHAVNLTGEDGALPYNIVVEGGKTPLREMIKKMKRGILIPNIWYHQIVNPSHWTVTGLTRGGAAWIEDGKIAGGLGRVRYLDGLLGALERTSSMSREQFALKVRDQGALVFPYIQIEDLRIV